MMILNCLKGFWKSTVEALTDMFKFKSDEIHPDINTTEIYA